MNCSAPIPGPRGDRDWWDCLGLACKPLCQFRHCRATAEPLWLHVRLALPTNVEPGPVRAAAWARRRRRRALVAARRSARA